MPNQPWSAEHPLDADRVRALLTDHYPDLPVRDVRYLAEGWDSQAFEIDHTWVFRFPKRALIQDDLKIEAALLPHLSAHLARIGLRVPVFDFVGQPSARFPFLFAGYRKILGLEATEVPVDEVPVEPLCKQIGAALTAIHSFPADRARALGVREDMASRLIGSMRDRALARLPELAPALTPALVAQVRDALAEIPPEYDGPRVLVHNDLHHEHLLLDPATRLLVGIIDWGDVGLGDPAVDLCGIHAWLGADAVRHVVSAYAAPLDPHALDRTRYRALCLGVFIGVHGVLTSAEDELAQARRALTLALA